MQAPFAVAEGVCIFSMILTFGIEYSIIRNGDDFMKTETKYIFLRISALLAGIGMIILGIYRGEVTEVFNKAVRICLECIGIG